MIDLPPAIDMTQVAPVTIECVQKVANAYHVPLAGLAAIMAQEGGQVGKASRNSNGTYDYGPMQINTIWLKHLKPYGITQTDLTWNGCLNVYVAGAIFHHHYVNSKGNVWNAIGNYHSKTPKYHDRYIKSVKTKLKKALSLKDIVERANNYLFKLVIRK